MKILNLGCGTKPFKDTKDITYLNVDMIKMKPPKGVTYMQHNILRFPYPIEPDYFDRIYLFHTIEHISEGYHRAFLSELRRLIKPDGQVCISYPEFLKVAEHYKKDTGGKRDFWKATIYGRGSSEYDFHKALMDTPFFVKLLREIGLDPITVKPERTQPFNTVVIAKKGEPMLSMEKLLEKEFAPRT